MIPAAWRIRLHPFRLRRTAAAASLVRRPARFVLNELRDLPAQRSYRLGGSGLTVCIRHPMIDMWLLEEVFRARCYALPPEVEACLGAKRGPLRVVDIGGNIGLFGLFVVELFEDAQIVSFEPDPGNAKVLASCVAANELGAQWTLVEACAGTADGSVEFSSNYHLSRAVPLSGSMLEEKHTRIREQIPFLAGAPLLDADQRTVSMQDVFPLLSGADLVKIDAEGAEWELLADERFRSVDAAVLVLEFHPGYSDKGETEATVRAALTGAGYEVGPTAIADDAGVLWAWKPAQ